MALATTTSPQQYTFNDYNQLLHHYVAELREVHHRNESVQKQKFTLIKAIDRDHRTIGGTHACVDSVARLEQILANLRGDQFSSQIDVSVVELVVGNIRAMHKVLQGLIQMYNQLRPQFVFEASQSDRAVEEVKFYLAPRTSILALENKFHLNLNDRESTQFGALLNLTPHLVQLADQPIAALHAHLRHIQREELEAIRQAQYKPPSPPLAAPPPPVCDAASQAQAEEIFGASRMCDSGTQLDAVDWRKQQLQEKHRNYVYSLGNFPPFAVDN